jgi:hypothetical protein
MFLVDPSGLVSNVIGRMPALILIVRTVVSVVVSTMLIVEVGIEPATANLPSGVT